MSVLDPYYTRAQILFVDDEPLIRKLLTRRLQRLVPGSTVACAASGAEALDMVKSSKPFHLILMDHFMPTGPGALDGAQTIGRLRSQLHVKTPIIGFSANDMSSQHMTAGANAFLVKPAPPNPELVRVLNSVVPK